MCTKFSGSLVGGRTQVADFPFVVIIIIMLQSMDISLGTKPEVTWKISIWDNFVSLRKYAILHTV